MTTLEAIGALVVIALAAMFGGYRVGRSNGIQIGREQRNSEWMALAASEQARLEKAILETPKPSTPAAAGARL